jgi:hypothetical protein
MIEYKAHAIEITNRFEYGGKLPRPHDDFRHQVCGGYCAYALTDVLTTEPSRVRLTLHQMADGDQPVSTLPFYKFDEPITHARRR